MDWEFCIRQRSDYVTKVKDHRWASNWITLEFEWTVQGCTLREWRVVRKYGLFTFVFLHVFNFQTNVTIYVWKIYSLNLLLMWLKELLLHKGSVKMGWILRHVLSPVLFEWAIRSLGKKRDSSLRNVQGPDSILHKTFLANCLVNSMLKKLRPVVRGVTLQWSKGVPVDPKEYSVAAISWLLQPYHPAFSDKRLKKPRLALRGNCVKVPMDLAVDHRWEDNKNYFPHTSDL